MSFSFRKQVGRAAGCACLALSLFTGIGRGEERRLIDGRPTASWKGGGQATLSPQAHGPASTLEVTIVNNGDGRENWPAVRYVFAPSASRDFSAFTFAAYRVRVTSSSPEVRAKDISLVFHPEGSAKQFYVRHTIPTGRWVDIQDDLSGYDLSNVRAINFTMYETDLTEHDTYTWEIEALRLSTRIAYDGGWLAETPPRERPEPKLVFLSAGQGLELGIAPQDPSQQEVRIKGHRLAGARAIPSGFLVRDVAASGPVLPVSGKLVRTSAGSLYQQANLKALGLGLEAKYRVQRHRVVVTGSITDTTGKDRAISLYYAVNVARQGLRWWNDVRDVQDVPGRGELSNLLHIPAGARGLKSRYPLAAVADSESGLCLARPMVRVAIDRLIYNAGAEQLYLVFDFGLSPATAKFPSRANFQFELFAIDPRWGFRSALERFYVAHPDHFVRRLQHEGIWMAFADIARVPWPLDFGFAFHEIGGSTFRKRASRARRMVEFDDRAGIYSFRYTTPEPFNMNLPKGTPRTYDAAMRVLKDGLARGKVPPVPLATARAQETCGATLQDGRYYHEFVDYSWVDGVRFVQNIDPDLPEPNGTINRAHLNFSPERAGARYARDTVAGNLDEGLDGEYLDSLEWFSKTPNFRREHFAVSDVSLTFSNKSRLPILIEGFSVAEFLRYLRPALRERGKLLMTNGQPAFFPGLAAWIDVGGSECSWYRKGTFQPMPDASLNWRRALFAKKPYLLLWNGDFRAINTHMIESYCKRCLLYGLYPSLFTDERKVRGRWTSRHYFQSPDLFERDRSHFIRFVPLIQRLNRAGWEPVTGARCADSAFWIERFGSLGQAPHLVVFNSAQGPRRTAVELLPELAPCSSRNRVAVDLLSGSMYDLPLPRLALGAQDVAALALGTPAELAAAELAEGARSAQRVATSLSLDAKEAAARKPTIAAARRLAQALSTACQLAASGSARAADLSSLLVRTRQLALQPVDDAAGKYLRRASTQLNAHLGRAMALLAGLRIRLALGPSPEPLGAAQITLELEGAHGKGLGTLTGHLPVSPSLDGPKDVNLKIGPGARSRLHWQVPRNTSSLYPFWVHYCFPLLWKPPWGAQALLPLEMDLQPVGKLSLNAEDTTALPERHSRRVVVTVQDRGWIPSSGRIGLEGIPDRWRVAKEPLAPGEVSNGKRRARFLVFIPEGAAPGTYRLRAVFKPAEGPALVTEFAIVYSPRPSAKRKPVIQPQ